VKLERKGPGGRRKDSVQRWERLGGKRKQIGSPACFPIGKNDIAKCGF
jgi:hypothetical protein